MTSFAWVIFFSLIHMLYALPHINTAISVAKRSSVFGGHVEYRNCEDYQVSSLKRHVRDAEAMAAEAYKLAVRGNRYYDAFFGKLPNNQKSALDDTTMQRRFDTLAHITTRQISNNYANVVIRCDYDYAPDRRCNSAVSAPMMTSTRTKEIFACLSFWRGDRYKDSRLASIAPPTPHNHILDRFIPNGGAVLHEFTHALWETADMSLKGGKTVMYGHEHTLLGVDQKGPRARQNADNYRLFAAAAYWSATRWGVSFSTDPKNLVGGGEL